MVYMTSLSAHIIFFVVGTYFALHFIHWHCRVKLLSNWFRLASTIVLISAFLAAGGVP